MTSWLCTLMVNGISSLQPKACTFVFCQFTSNTRDAASLAIVSNMRTKSYSSSARRETSSAKSRSVKELWPNVTPIEQDSTVLSSNQYMLVRGEGYYVFTMSRCPDVRPVPASAFLSLCTNIEYISMKFAGGDHYQQQMNWLHFG